jgi:tetratricopeptide (TPR) repeat protein
LVDVESKHRPETLDAHPLVREHFGKQLKQEYPDAWREGNNRLYEYYKTAAKELPDTLEEMAPLFAAVMHGCRAGKHQDALDEVYWKRIMREQKFFASKKLGAMGSLLSVLSAFFDLPWYEVTKLFSPTAQGNILAESSYYLRALGRLGEAAQPMQAGLDVALAQNEWMHSAIRAKNVSELYLTLGDMKQAIAYAEQSLELAERSGDGFIRESSRLGFANALLKAGRLKESRKVFQEAEEIHQKNEPQSPILYSDGGFQYCDLLLSQGNYTEVERRASQTVKYAEQGWYSLLSIALDNLSLGQAHLLRSQRESNHSFTKSITYINRAVDGLRQAGTQHHIPRGLFARAEYYRLTRDLHRAKRDLDEAFTIATRGGMGLHLADCHLEYARLYLAYVSLRGQSPKQSPNESGIASSHASSTGQESTVPPLSAKLLAMTDDELKSKARKHWQIAKDSIEKMGYHRRDKEVQELEEQLK